MIAVRLCDRLRMVPYPVIELNQRLDADRRVLRRKNPRREHQFKRRDRTAIVALARLDIILVHCRALLKPQLKVLLGHRLLFPASAD